MSIKNSISELISVIDSQWTNGMIPHIRFLDGETGYSPGPAEWECYNKTEKDIFTSTSGITQPPVIAISLLKIITSLNTHNSYLDSLDYIINGIEKFHDFLFRDRDPNNEYLITIIHPWESGLDNSPVFDEDNKYARNILDKMNIKQQIIDRQDLKKVIAEFRPGEKDYDVYGKLIGFYKLHIYNQNLLSNSSPFRVQDCLYNVLLCISLESMISIYETYAFLNTNSSELLLKNKKRLSFLKEAMSKKLYDSEKHNYYSYSLNLNERIEITTVQTLITNLYYSKTTSMVIESINAYSDNSTLHFLSTPINSQYFNAVKYWRGPIWPIINWIIIELIKKFDLALSIQLAKNTLNLISEGFNRDETYTNAKNLMNFNLVNNTFTTPSKNQYKHGWFWDSAFASIGWIHSDVKNSINIYQNIFDDKTTLINEGKDLYEIRQILKKKYKVALFDEYYTGIQTDTFNIGEPIGSEMMTWTAAVYLDLYNHIENS